MTRTTTKTNQDKQDKIIGEALTGDEPVSDLVNSKLSRDEQIRQKKLVKDAYPFEEHGL